MTPWTPVSQPLAPYASHWSRSRGRQHSEPASTDRSEFRRDCDRILHSSAFRRLSYKTQVFVDAVGQNYRTRLTHSLEVSQIARAIARTLGLDEDLAEALALSHDLGHTCFGHAGEDALQDCMQDFGGFDHNAQSLRTVTVLEKRYGSFNGLNLTWETLEGLIKHNGPLRGPLARKQTPISGFVKHFCNAFDLELHTFAGPEAQVAAISDDIAYNAHDLDDGLRAGFVTLQDTAGRVPLIARILAEVDARYPELEHKRRIHETIRRLITLLITDVCRETTGRLSDLAPESVEDIRNAGAPVVAFGDTMARDLECLSAFLFERLYRHYRVNRMTSKARRVVKDLFNRFVLEPTILPDDWRKTAGDPNTEATAKVVCDYIAGMTDHFALDEHARLFDPLVKP